MFCDLHLHSTASDGTDAPEDLPRLAKEARLHAIALTDHDTTAGIEACAAAAAREGVAFVPGIELSADPDSVPPKRPDGAPRGTMHLLGYFVRHDDATLLKIQGRLRKAREQRNPEMVERLNELGVKITYDEVVAQAGGPGGGGSGGGGVVGRPHIAQVMLDKGYVKSIHEAFTRYLGESTGLAYVRKDRLSAEDAIAAIHAAGGLAFLAHPVQLRLPTSDDLELCLKQLKTLGLDGLETRHSDHTPADVSRFEALAQKHSLLPCGGSDYHGTRKNLALGASKVPLSIYDALLAARATV